LEVTPGPLDGPVRGFVFGWKLAAELAENEEPSGLQSLEILSGVAPQSVGFDQLPRRALSGWQLFAAGPFIGSGMASNPFSCSMESVGVGTFTAMTGTDGRLGGLWLTPQADPSHPSASLAGFSFP
jgi:hypothetical protein